MLAFDSGGLLRALRQVSARAGDKRWKAGVEGFDLIARLSAELPLGGMSHTSTTINTVATVEAFVALLNRYSLVPEDYKTDGIGIVTSTRQQIGFSVPAELVVVRRTSSVGGHSKFVMVQARELKVFDFEHPLTPSSPLPTWLPAQTHRESVACIPVEGGTLWVVPTPAASRLELFAKAHETMAAVSKSEPSFRWASVLLPVVTVQMHDRLAPLCGASLGAAGPKLLDVFQLFRLSYDTKSLRRIASPKASLDEPRPLAYNVPALVFKTGRDQMVQWLYHATPSDWDVFGGK